MRKDRVRAFLAGNRAGMEAGRPGVWRGRMENLAGLGQRQGAVAAHVHSHGPQRARPPQKQKSSEQEPLLDGLTTDHWSVRGQLVT